MFHGRLLTPGPSDQAGRGDSGYGHNEPVLLPAGHLPCSPSPMSYGILLTNWDVGVGPWVIYQHADIGRLLLILEYKLWKQQTNIRFQTISNLKKFLFVYLYVFLPNISRVSHKKNMSYLTLLCNFFELSEKTLPIICHKILQMAILQKQDQPMQKLLYGRYFSISLDVHPMQIIFRWFAWVRHASRWSLNLHVWSARLCVGFAFWIPTYC